MLAGFSCLTSLTNVTFEETLPIPDLNTLTEEVGYKLLIHPFYLGICPFSNSITRHFQDVHSFIIL